MTDLVHLFRELIQNLEFTPMFDLSFCALSQNDDGCWRDSNKTHSTSTHYLQQGWA